jgi:hypothetical protein
MKRKFPTKDIQELAFGSFDGYILIEDEHQDSSRWMEFRRLVFKFDDKYYAFDYEVGLTEIQEDCGTFDEAGDEVECYEVEPKEVASIVYVLVND